MTMEGSSDFSEDFSGTVFWFLHENSNLPDNFSGSSSSDVDYDDKNDDELNSDHEEKKSAFWTAQLQLLQATLCRTTPIESRIRQATEEVLRESAPPCHCRRSAAAGTCRSCSRKEISERLCRAGLDCSVRCSKCNRSSIVPSGEHTYLEVMAGEKVKVIIELHFRAEFEMARTGEDYNRLISCLPEVFVGKSEKLRNLVKILCGAAKKCMKEKEIHIGPWRKLKYVQSKWLTSTCEIAESVAATTGFSGECQNMPIRPTASMLTIALIGNLPGSHCQVVAVV